MFLKGFMSKIGATMTSLAMAFPVIADGLQAGDLDKLWAIGGGLLLSWGLIRKFEGMEKK